MIRKLAVSAAFMLAAVVAVPAAAQPYPGEAEFRGLYKELIAINTPLSAGSCTQAAQAMFR